MSAPSLTAKYRPQRFSDVAGQEAIKRILSKAAAEDKIAPAYLFSGTRGVGKTTLARVLAKTLNCVTAPAAEPCNECHQCRQITAGISPDVIEIDAATHGTVDEARRLKEDIGYAPLQSRYKVFIIDEAHMLSKAAFNALLKTLEEPPPRVTFILATTEPHKILPTIISRCQHYVFKRLAQPELEAHLVGLLNREGMGFEAGAVSLIARRGAGSVRDSMSLLAQVLAVGGEKLTEQDVRDVLGLAGQDVFFSFMGCFLEQDCLGVSGLLRGVLDRGLDIGFFLRELASCWRTMFLLSQAGEKALSTLELTEEEGAQWLQWASRFEASQIHACWQMTLDGQRRVMTSLEPALALELLLLNLAYIPRLLSLESLQNSGGQPAGRPGPAGGAPRPAPASGTGGQGGYQGGYGAQPKPAMRDSLPEAAKPAYPQTAASSGSPAPRPVSPASHGGGAGHHTANRPAPAASPKEPSAVTTPPAASEPEPQEATGDAYAEYADMAVSQEQASHSLGEASAPARTPTGDARAGRADAPPPPAAEPKPAGPANWKGFYHYLRECSKETGPVIPGLPGLKGSVEEHSGGLRLTLHCMGEAHHRQLTGNQEILSALRRWAGQYFGSMADLVFDAGKAPAVNDKKALRAKAEQKPLVKEAEKLFGSHILDVFPKS